MDNKTQENEIINFFLFEKGWVSENTSKHSVEASALKFCVYMETESENLTAPTKLQVELCYLSQSNFTNTE